MLRDTASLAWRNLGRNPRRTFTTGVALAFGICLCVASYGLMDGLSAQLLHSLTRLDLGHVQIHTRRYVDKRALDRTIGEADAVAARVRGAPGVRGAAPRLYGFALLGNKDRSSGVELVGVDPAHEPRVTELSAQLRQGRYLTEPTPWPRGRELTAEEKARDRALTEAAEERAFEEIDELPSIGGDAPAAPPGAEGPARATPAPTDAEATRRLAIALSPRPSGPLPILLGEGLAKVLGAKLGSELYATTMAADGTSEAVFVVIAGVYKTGTQLHDRHRIYLHIADARRLAHLDAAAHEIAVALDDTAAAPEAAAALGQELRGVQGGALWVRSWKQVRPDMDKMLKLNDVSTDIMVFIIFLVASLGVVNTMLMSVFERTRELGVLKAIGMSGGRIMLLVVIESLFLVLGAAAAGTLLGLGLDLYMVKHGVDLTRFTAGIDMGGIGLKPIIYGVITARGLYMPTALLSACCVLASLYPAARAARLEPAVGMRET